MLTCATERSRSAQELAREQLLDILAGFMRTQALSILAQLGVADIVSDSPVDVAHIARCVGAHEASLCRLMRFVASEGVFAEVEPGHFTSTALSIGLRSDSPMTARWLALMFGSEHYAAWGAALHTFVTGEPAFDRVYGRSLFDYLAEAPDASRVFDRAMAAGAQSRAGGLLNYDWKSVDRVADIGGGNGAALSILLSSHPHLHGVLFDQANVVGAAEDVLRDAGVRDRCDIVSGDFFTDELPRADAYVLCHVLHDWNDQRARAILQNCRRALTRSGRLILVDETLPDGPEPSFGKLLDLHMLVMLGGKERNETEWRTLLARERFELRAITPQGLIDARPR